MKGELAFDFGGTREHGLHQRGQALTQARRSRNAQGRGTAADKLRIEDQERQTAEVIPVKMGQEDRLDCIGINPEAAHSDEGGRPAVDQESRGRRLDMEACVEPTA